MISKIEDKTLSKNQLIHLHFALGKSFEDIKRYEDSFRNLNKANQYLSEIVGYDIASDLQLEKLRREHNAGVHTVDVLFNSESSILLNEALPAKLVWNFIPESVSDELTESEKSPLLIQRHSSRIVYYNTMLNPNGAPINSLWDMTREEWSGRTLLPSPLEDSLSANFIQTILANPEDMAAAYQREFGEPVSYSEAVIEAVENIATIDKPNASIEWLYRFLQNEPVFQGSTTKIFKNVGAVSYTHLTLPTNREV